MAAPALKTQGVDGLGGPAVSSTAMTGWDDGSVAMMVGIRIFFARGRPAIPARDKRLSHHG
jgi:hypothetical protein